MKGVSTMQTELTRLLKPDPKNPRKPPDAEGPHKAEWDREINLLGEDMLARGCLVPLLIDPERLIIDGWRRWLAALHKSIERLPVIVLDKPLSDKDKLGIQLATAFHRADLSLYDKWLATAQLLAGNVGWEQKDVARFLNVADGQVTRILSPSKCTLRWQEALKAGKVDFSKTYTASKLGSAAEQDALLDFVLNAEKDGKKVSRDALERQRKRRTGQAPAVKVDRLKCPLPSGVTVQISGEGIDLDLALEAAQEWVKEVKRAIDQGLDAKTFERVCRDKSKKS